MTSDLTRWGKYDLRRLGILFLAGIAFGIFYGIIFFGRSLEWLLTKRPEKED